MSLNHLLSLSALHAAAPGVLGVIFGADGDFEGAPRWTAPIWCADAKGASRFEVYDWPPQDAWPETYHLDLRVRSVAQRLASLCCRAADPRKDIHTWRRAADLADRAARCEWLDDYAATLASLSLSLAPQIAALRGTS